MAALAASALCCCLERTDDELVGWFLLDGESLSSSIGRSGVLLFIFCSLKFFFSFFFCHGFANHRRSGEPTFFVFVSLSIDPPSFVRSTLCCVYLW